MVLKKQTLSQRYDTLEAANNAFDEYLKNSPAEDAWEEQERVLYSAICVARENLPFGMRSLAATELYDLIKRTKEKHRKAVEERS